MTKLLSTALPTTGTTTHFALDSHAAVFFEPSYLNGGVEARFRLGVKGLEKHVFVGRLARLVTGEWAGVVQEEQSPSGKNTGVDAFCLILENVAAAAFSGSPSAEDIQEFWAKQLVSKASSLPTFRGKFWRPYYDKINYPNLGLRLLTNGECHLLDLRQPVSQENDIHAHRLHIDLGKDWLIMATGTSLRVAFATISTAMFARQMRVTTRDAARRLHHTLEFYSLSESEQCVDVLELSDEIRREIQLLVQYLLHYEMQPGRRLVRYNNVTRSPWHTIRLQRVSSPGRSRHSKTPGWLRKYLKEVCSLFQYSPSALPPLTQGVGFYAEMVRSEWAFDIKIELSTPSGHDLFIAASKIQERQPPSFQF